MDAIINEAILWAITIVLFVLIGVFYKKLPAKLAKSLTTSVVFMMSSILLMNFLKARIPALNPDGVAIPTVCGIIALLIAVAFLVVYLVKNEEIQRRIFFNIAVCIFGIAYIYFLIDVINGTGSLPAHLCRQISYAFPIVYFSKYARKFLLNYFVLAAIIGAAFTIYAPDNVLTGSVVTYGDIDTVITHVAMLLISAILLTTKEVRLKLHDTWQFVVFLGVNTLLAWLYNYIQFANTGNWGNGMYLVEPVIDGVPWWLFGIICILIAAIIVVCFNIKTIINFFKNKKAEQIGASGSEASEQKTISQAGETKAAEAKPEKAKTRK